MASELAYGRRAGLRVLFDRVGKPEIIDRPPVIQPGGAGGSIPIDRADSSPRSIKTAVDILKNGEIILIFPTGLRKAESVAFRRGAATVVLHARVLIVPASYEGPGHMQMAADPRELREPGLGLGRDPVRTPMPWDESRNAAPAARRNVQPLFVAASPVSKFEMICGSKRSASGRIRF